MTHARCASSSVYLAPGRKVSLRQHRLVAVLGSERIEITHRDQIAELVATHGWDGTCELAARNAAPGTPPESVLLDPRLAAGHLPENAAWWRIQQLLDEATLAEVGGPRQLAEVLFGASHKKLGTAAFDAVLAGQTRNVCTLAGLVMGPDGLLVEPDVLVRILAATAEHPSVGWWAPSDPGDWAAAAALLAGIPAEYREQLLVELLTRLPDGVTPALARTWALDEAWTAWLVAEASWPIVLATLETRAKAGVLTDVEHAAYAEVLRSRGILGACAHGDRDAYQAAALVPALAGMASAAYAHALEAALGDEVEERRNAAWQLGAFAPHALSRAAALFETALGDEDSEVRRNAAWKLEPMIHYDPVLTATLLETALGDRDPMVRSASTRQITAFAPHDPVRALSFLEIALVDEDPEVRRNAASQIGALAGHDLVRAVAFLETALGDKDWRTRRNAAWQLGALAPHDPARVTTLKEIALGDEDQEVRSAASRIGAFTPHDPVLTATFLETALGNRDPMVRSATTRQITAFAPHDPVLALSFLETALGDEDPEVRRNAASQIGAFAGHDPVRAWALFETALDDADPEARSNAASQFGTFAGLDPVRAGTLTTRVQRVGHLDAELVLILAAHGAAMPDPLMETLRDAARAVRSDPKAAAELPKVRTARAMVGLAFKFTYPTSTLSALDRLELPTELVTATAGPMMTRVIRSQAELQRNADMMQNCTAGYASALQRGDVMLAIGPAEGRPAYNAHLVPTSDGWRVGEVNSRMNLRGAAADRIEAWLQDALTGLLPELPHRDG